MVFDAIRKYKEGVQMIRNSARKTNRNRTRDKIMKIGYDGLPQLFKIAKWNTPEVNGRDDPLHLDYIPIYETCVCCKLSLARIEEECNAELGGYCLGCFKIVTEQKDDSPFGEFLCPVGKCSKVKLTTKKDPIKIKRKQTRSPTMERKN